MKTLFKTACAAMAFLCAAAFGMTIDAGTEVIFEREGAIKSEQTACDELSMYLKRIFGENGKAKSRIYVGWHSETIQHLGNDALAKLGPEEFRVVSDGERLFIVGGRPRGTMYGVFWFLDRRLGVHWLTPDCEHVPRMKEFELPKIDNFGRPAFGARILQTEEHGSDTPEARRWRAHNLFNSGFGGIFTCDDTYGEELIFSPPSACHGLHLIVTRAKYFAEHPEFWALQNGKRTCPEAGRGVSADYCLTNEGLIETTVNECRELLRKNPTARYISIQEGDNTQGYCECEPCKKLVAECGGKESARWVYFANNVARRLKGEFPKVQFLIFAYARSKEPPKNIKADENVCVELCAWGNRRGLPYAHPKNTNGLGLMAQLAEWKTISKHILLWDYTYSFGDTLLQSPDLLLNIDNLKAFSEVGVDGIFTENGVPQHIAFGMPYKAWLIPRAMWNPDECGDGEALERTFCREYYGDESGNLAADYLKLLRDANRRQGFVNFTSGGTIGKADFESAETTLKAYALLNEAFEKASDDVRRDRIHSFMLPMQYQVLRNYKKLSDTGKIRESFDELSSSMKAFLSARMNTRYEKFNYSRYLKRIDALAKIKDVNADSSQSYGSMYAQCGYDGDINTMWHSASQEGWCQIQFDAPREIRRVTSVIAQFGQAVSVDYELRGSLDGTEWFVISPWKTVEYRDPLLWIYDDVALEKPLNAKYVRTFIRRARMKTGGMNDVLLYEQYFNAESLPKELEQKH
ncbi:MAG: DUF4838 domain-containing protein [Victivallales bacterium]|nr:DUF4838 domain-containing protein [Victivallales bacterium]